MRASLPTHNGSGRLHFPAIKVFAILIALLFLLQPDVRADDAPPWIAAMKAVHSRFTGRHGSFAQFGDSITVTQAFWSPLQWQTKNMDQPASKALENVKAYILKDSWSWKGEKFGNESGKTADWADERADQWLKDMNPEVAVMMFGTNDLVHLPVDQYEKHMRSVIDKCLRNGTIVILTTIPPRHDMLEKARHYADIDIKIAAGLKLPQVDFFGEILKRRPNDWDGADPKFKTAAGGGYEAETPIGSDGVHPSNPQKFVGDFSEESLNHSGYSLRTYLTLVEYDRVIASVLK